MIERGCSGPAFLDHRRRIVELLWKFRGALDRHCRRHERNPESWAIVDELGRVEDQLAEIIAELDQGEAGS